MGKKGTPLGRSLIKDRFGATKGRKYNADKSMLHTTEIQDGYDWGRLNLQSVTEESSFQEFLSTAELTGAEFLAEKLDIKFVNPKSNIGLLTRDEKRKRKDLHEKNKSELKIPRRPFWDTKTSKEELDSNEKQAFLEWRRSLLALQEEQGILLTPYEKNLEFWRQLWRVVERSDVIVQIVDARNPLLFYCEDLVKYAKEVSQNKMSLILVNKAELLTDDQRQSWIDYFTSVGLQVVFYSAVLATATIKSEIVQDTHDFEINDSNVESLKTAVKTLEENVEQIAAKLNALTHFFSISSHKEFVNSKDILTREQLTEVFRGLHKAEKVTENVTTIGLVGYPNVGKSSTINSLLLAKKVSVSATPGKTKHFQTIFLDQDILLCDCPGLVMPSFVFSKAEMIINGILPIDQMRDHVPPINLIAHHIPKHILEDKYGIMLPLPLDVEDPNRPPTSEELLNSYAYNRGFMTANGQPDNARAARYILKDYMNGKLLYCHAPPNSSQEDYHRWSECRQTTRSLNKAPPRQVRASQSVRATPTPAKVDTDFFRPAKDGVYVKGQMPLKMLLEAPGDKPWKKINKHANKNKKEKLRRVYAHLDQH